MAFSRNCLKAARWVSLIVFLAALAFGQSERGTITGAVRDQSGAVVPQADVTLTNQATNIAIHAITNDAGEFTVPNLPPGAYNRSRREARLPRVPGTRRFPRRSPNRARRCDSPGRLRQPGRSKSRPRPFPSRPKTPREYDHSRTTWSTTCLCWSTEPFARHSISLRSRPMRKISAAITDSCVGGGQAAAYGTTLDGVSTNTSRAFRKAGSPPILPSVEAIDQFTVDSSGYKAEYGHGARRHDLRLQVRRQPVPRLGLRIPPQQRFRRQ